MQSQVGDREQLHYNDLDVHGEGRDAACVGFQLGDAPVPEVWLQTRSIHLEFL